MTNLNELKWIKARVITHRGSIIEVRRVFRRAWVARINSMDCDGCVHEGTRSAEVIRLAKEQIDGWERGNE